MRPEQKPWISVVHHESFITSNRRIRVNLEDAFDALSYCTPFFYRPDREAERELAVPFGSVRLHLERSRVTIKKEMKLIMLRRKSALSQKEEEVKDKIVKGGKAKEALLNFPVLIYALCLKLGSI